MGQQQRKGESCPRPLSQETLPIQIAFEKPWRKKVEKSIAQKIGIKERRQEVQKPLPQKVCLKEARQKIKEPLPQKVCFKEVLKEDQEPFQKEIRVKEVRKVRKGRKIAAMAVRRLHIDSSSLTVWGHFYGDTADWVYGDL